MAGGSQKGARIRWDEIRAVGLDLMDTLLADPFREAFREVAGATPEELAPVVDRGAWIEFELGKIDEATYGRRFFRAGSGRTLDAARLRAALLRRYRFLPGMEALARELAARVPLHVMTNYSPWYEAIRSRFALDRFAAGHHPSYAIGARKPDPDYFRAALARIGVRERALLFVDDRERNVAGARALGIPALLFRGADDLRARLEPLLARPPC